MLSIVIFMLNKKGNSNSNKQNRNIQAQNSNGHVFSVCLWLWRFRGLSDGWDVSERGSEGGENELWDIVFTEEDKGVHLKKIGRDALKTFVPESLHDLRLLVNLSGA